MIFPLLVYHQTVSFVFREWGNFVAEKALEALFINFEYKKKRY